MDKTKKNDHQDHELTPDRARFQGARLRGFAVDVQEVDGEWQVGVVGMLILPASRGKRTSVFHARGPCPEKATQCAMAACRRAYGAAVAAPITPPKAG